MLFAIISANSSTLWNGMSSKYVTSVVFKDVTMAILIIHQQVVPICYVYSYIVLLCLLMYALL